MFRTILITLLLLTAFATTAEAKPDPVDSANDVIEKVDHQTCDHLKVSCLKDPRPVPDPFDPCTCPPIE